MFNHSVPCSLLLFWVSEKAQALGWGQIHVQTLILLQGDGSHAGQTHA